ncbi:MAG: pyridoxamine 5'-phosphate oxidase family protein [Bosea sp. (in: a-proteobacteria)]
MSDQPIPTFYNDLAETRVQAWALLARGVADRRSPFHAPTVASLGLDGRPRARVVIMRACDVTKATLRFNTDRRTEKFAELSRDPRISLTGYDAGSKIQVRAEGVASLHTDDAVADTAWEASRQFSRICYGTVPAPGTLLGDGGGFSLPSEDAEIAAGRANFSTVVIKVRTLEWLYLAHAGHRRARFDVGGEGMWLTP